MESQCTNSPFSDGIPRKSEILAVSSGSTRNFFWGGGIEGEKCNSEGAKIQKFAENG